ncbi:LuxR C-terminal-related transcriptional regulator [Sinimarinibacterium sp. NLF-5-8]|uniref:LuxR C-terminal-related transcriptional regulator n=1 Tax=Sinimarinibacterium sp. NLF-5-8 TaxID=2698684 RepID=UPI00137BD59D|nr:LuxR C-terminal-related transcriptional regulator [Sinimarinibacterium sp. NLF-5-8]QHS10192.1 LuxR family transcriptional regulator [Sinimarinibacterium sp. NLF-5-8]
MLNRLKQHDGARVVVLQGPAGHGKTTALLQIRQTCQAAGQMTAWLTLDEADNDPRRFFVHMRALVRELDPSAETQPLDGRSRRRSDWMIDILSRLEKPAALFLDEFQTLSTPEILRFFREFIEHVPENVTILMGSRSVPDIGLPRATIEGRALVIPADELRFSVDEVRSFFANAPELEMAAGEVDAVYRQTEGWPAALQLFRLSLGRRSVRESLDMLDQHRPRELANYLTDNVLAAQPQQIQTFLLRTSVLTRLCGRLCEAVTGMGDAQMILENLERSGLFLRGLDANRHWFKYHGLFSTSLADQLKAHEPETLRAVHARAAQWYAAENMPEETVFHALACQDWLLAASTLEHWAQQLVADGQILTLERWASRLPWEVMARRPRLLIKVGWAYVFLHRHAALKPVQAALEQLERSGEPCVDVVLTMAAISADQLEQAFARVQRVDLNVQDCSVFRAFELAAAGNVAAYHAIGQNAFDKARALTELANRHSRRGAAAFSGGYTAALSALSQLLQGDLRGALIQFQQFTGEVRPMQDRSLASAVMHACYLWALYEAHDLDTARALGERHYDIIMESTLPDFTALALISMARIEDGCGRKTQADEWLDRLEAHARSNGLSRLLLLTGWERVRRALAGGYLSYAQTLAASVPLAPDAPPQWMLFTDTLANPIHAAIRLAIQSGQSAVAQRWLQIEHQRASARPYARMRLSILEACWHLRNREDRAALRALTEAIRVGAVGGIIGAFVEERETLLPLLLRMQQTPPAGVPQAADYLDQLVRACGGASTTAAAMPEKMVEALTEKEQAILGLLAKGVSNKQMAKNLFVSENTIKFHLKNIYAKLGVDNRLRAITAARDHGLLD